MAYQYDWSGTNKTRYANFANMYNRAGKRGKFAIRSSLKMNNAIKSTHHVGVGGHYVGMTVPTAIILGGTAAAGYVGGRKQGMKAGAVNAKKAMPVAYAKGFKAGL